MSIQNVPRGLFFVCHTMLLQQVFVFKKKTRNRRGRRRRRTRTPWVVFMFQFKFSLHHDVSYHICPCILTCYMRSYLRYMIVHIFSSLDMGQLPGNYLRKLHGEIHSIYCRVQVVYIYYAFACRFTHSYYVNATGATSKQIPSQTSY